MFKKWGSLCFIHDVNDNRDNIKLIYFTEVSLFFNNPTTPWCPCLILAQFLQWSWQKLGSCILLAVELVTSQVLLHWPKICGPMGRFSNIGCIFLKLPVAWLPRLLVFIVHCVGMHYCAQGSYLVTDVPFSGGWEPNAVIMEHHSMCSHSLLDLKAWTQYWWLAAKVWNSAYVVLIIKYVFMLKMVCFLSFFFWDVIYNSTQLEKVCDIKYYVKIYTSLL